MSWIHHLLRGMGSVLDLFPTVDLPDHNLDGAVVRPCMSGALISHTTGRWWTDGHRWLHYPSMDPIEDPLLLAQLREIAQWTAR